MKTKLALATLVLGLAIAPASGFTLVNVNFNGFTPSTNPGPTQDSTTLVGPAGGLGTTWNQFAAPSGGGLLDANGTGTGISFTTNFTEGRYDGTGPGLTMLRATLTDFGRGQTRTVTMSGLEAGGLYDIWLVSHRQQSGAAPNYIERQLGTWTALNPTWSPTTQLVDGVSSGATPQGNQFVEGMNYVLFERVMADANGQIVFQGQAATVNGGFDADYRLHLSGFQILQVPEPSSALLVGLGGLMVFIRRRRA